MRCKYHPEQDAAIECAVCHSTFCPGCVRPLDGEPVCVECERQAVGLLKRSKLPKYENISPTTAGWLAVIPCMGAVYNGTYKRALVQFLGFLLIPSAIHSLLPVVSHFAPPITMIYYVYTIIDAVRMAKALKEGQELDEAPLFKSEISSHYWIGAGLILLGVVFLLQNLDVDLVLVRRYWPVALIGYGVYLLFRQARGGSDAFSDLDGRKIGEGPAGGRPGSSDSSVR